MKRFLAVLATAALLGTGAAVATAGPASAHTPAISASCQEGVVLTASNYSSNKGHPSDNTWSITVNGKTTSGNFATNTEQKVALPGDGETSTWSASITAWDNKHYNASDGGTLTCGVKPPTPITTAASITVTNPNCALPVNTLTVTTPEHVRINGFPSGTYTAEDIAKQYGLTDIYHEWTVTPTADEGYSYTGGPISFTLKAPPTEAECFVPVYEVHIQDYNTCTLNAFVLDNTGSNVAVVYDINGKKFPVAAGTAVHTDADGTSLTPNADGKFVITTDHGESWTFTAKTKQECTEKPEDKVTFTEWKDSENNCSLDQIVETRDKVTTTYTWDDETQTYVGTDTTEQEVQQRDKTDAEKEACATPPTDDQTPPTDNETTPPVTQTPKPPVTQTGTDVNCSTVGATNIRIGDALYSPDLDADNDGVACESAVAPVKVTPQVKKAQAAELAYTGTEGMVPLGIAALIILLAGAGILVARKRHSSTK